MFIAKITIRLKRGISDPEGANTLKALHLLGFDKIKEAKTIRIFELLIDSNDKNQVQNDVEKMCQRLLTNPVIHNYSVEIKEE